MAHTLFAPQADTRVLASGQLVVLGAVAGACFGAALRAWMRLVSADPEFTWAGTLFIVGAFTALGTVAGLVATGRRRGWQRRLLAARGIGLVIGLVCFSGGGIPMLPTVVPAGLALGRLDWPRPVRLALAAVATAVAVAVVLTLPGVSGPRRSAALPAYLALSVAEAGLFAMLFAPSRPARSMSRSARTLLAVAVVGGGLFVLFMMVGVRQ